MAKTALFSNGHRDTYKGRRDVRAAWMVVLPDGSIRSGHSLDRGRATRTATAKAREEVRPYWTGMFYHQGRMPACQVRSAESYARKHGFQSFRGLEQFTKLETARRLLKCKIEVIDI